VFETLMREHYLRGLSEGLREDGILSRNDGEG
jgi:hypothetical protein